MVFVVVDRFTKMVHFIPCINEHDESQIANIFFKIVVRIHGLPMTILIDRDTKFIGHFWRTFYKKLGTHLSYSLAYHP